MRRRALGLLLAVGVALAAAGCSDDAEPLPVVRRLAIVSLPGVAWSDVLGGSMPVLQGFAADGAVGNLASRIGRDRTEPAAAYLTISAGTRAVAPDIDADLALEDDEAAALSSRRLGPGTAGVAYPAYDAAADLNERTSWIAETGLLGRLLADDGVVRAVVANADRLAADGTWERHRAAAAALAGPDGRLSGTALSSRLLRADESAPYGVRLDPAAVDAAFADAWEGQGRRVVLVEASDLLRAASYAPVATGAQAHAARRHALVAADELLGTVLAHVDRRRDAVLVVSPVPTPAGQPLGVAALQAPAWAGGLLRSATTRRDGYVQLADVTPTVLELLGLEAPGKIEGRRFRSTGGAADVARLADEADAARARDQLVPGVTTALIAFLVVLLGATLLRRRLPRAALLPLRLGAYGAFGAVAGTYLAPQLGEGARSLGPHLGVLAACGAGSAGVVHLLTRRRPTAGLLVAAATPTLLLAADVAAGAGLQLNAVYGYSVAVAGRFAGVGNLAFALLGASAVVVAVAMAAHRGDGGGRAVPILLGAVLLVDALPFLGADVGGLVSMVPAFGAVVLVLRDRRIGPREVVALGLTTLATLLLFAILDLGRPDSSQTHLARVARLLVTGHWDELGASLARRWEANFGSAEVAVWLAVAGVVVATAIHVAWRWPGRRHRARPTWDRPTAAAVTGLVVLAVVGLVANDSSVAVPTTMLLVVTPAAVLRVLDA